jgi:hypothetical protein
MQQPGAPQTEELFITNSIEADSAGQLRHLSFTV